MSVLLEQVAVLLGLQVPDLRLGERRVRGRRRRCSATRTQLRASRVGRDLEPVEAAGDGAGSARSGRAARAAVLEARAAACRRTLEMTPVRLRPVIGPPPAVVNPCAMSPAATASQVRRRPGARPRHRGCRARPPSAPWRDARPVQRPCGGCWGLRRRRGRGGAGRGEGAGPWRWTSRAAVARRAGDRANAAGDGKPTLRSGCGRQATAEDGSDTVACTAREGVSHTRTEVLKR